jgi:hypothetical protein
LKPEPARKDYVWAEDRYPTQEEFATYGGETSATATQPAAAFDGDTWAASSEVKFTWVNNASAKLHVSLIDTDGKVVNESEGGYQGSMYRPFDYGPHTTRVSTSAVHHQCGVTGKSKISIAASLYLANFVHDSNPTRVWERAFSYNGNDVSRPACSPAPCPDGGSGVAEGDRVRCPREENQPAGDGGGGGDCWDCLDEPPQGTYCRVKYWYWLDTGEVFDYTILGAREGDRTLSVTHFVHGDHAHSDFRSAPVAPGSGYFRSAIERHCSGTPIAARDHHTRE